MALLKGKLFAGALFAGTLLGSQVEITTPPQVVSPPQTAGFGGGYFPKDTPKLRENQVEVEARKLLKQQHEEDEILLAVIMNAVTKGLI